MSLDLSTLLPAIQAAEQKAAGFAQTLSTAISSNAAVTELNALLSAVSPKLAGVEAAALADIKAACDTIVKLGPTIQSLITAGSALVAYLPQLLAVFHAASPAAPIVPPKA